jgi:uncharacterized protein (TIGR03083 family)
MSETDRRVARLDGASTAASEIVRPDRNQCVDVLAAEVSAITAAVGDLSADDWSRPTMSTGWSVRDMLAHVGGQWEEMAHFSRLLGRLRTARHRYPGRTVLDGHNQVQLDDIADQPTDVIVGRLQSFGPASVRVLRRLPGVMRRTPTRWFFPEPPLPEPGLGYLFDVVVARDTWMHRLEIARATDRAFVVGAHDGYVVAQIVRDLGVAWTGPPTTLEVTSRAGGTWTLGRGAPTQTVSVDPLELALSLSGRPATGISPHTPLATARVVF